MFDRKRGWTGGPSGVSLLLLVGCSGGGTVPPAGAADDAASSTSDLADVLQRANASKSLYSFRYLDGERKLYIHIPAYDSALTCATLGMAGKSDLIWYLEISLPWSMPGNPFNLTLSPPLVDASADVVRADPRTRSRWTAPATGGTVTLDSAPADEAGQRAGSLLVGHAALLFPKHSESERGCTGASSEASTGQECVCEDLQGVQTTCRKTGSTTCCAEGMELSEKQDVQFSASPCALLCTTTPGAPDDCAML